MAQTVIYPVADFVLPIEGEEDRVFPDCLPQRFMNHEAMAVERSAGMTFDQFLKGISDGSALCLTTWVWILMRREDPKIRIGDVSFRILGYSLRFDDPELEDIDSDSLEDIEELGRVEEDSNPDVPAGTDPTPPATASPENTDA